uniref:asparagine synthase (glutamine-hydrolyzing) n=1 Tax=Algoriphagus sp. TaxID=1872435 RepID=UPI00404805AF
MCGIAGFVSKNKDVLNISDAIINDMLLSISHRGTDSSGKYSEIVNDYNITIGHNRLSILELSEVGSQPYVFENFIIVYNGEIYNYKELTDILIENNYTITSNCDTEVLVKMFHLMGVKSLDYFNGMFSICIFDTNSKDFFLIRDRLGVKPLYYFKLEDSFGFSSELKSFFNFPNLISSLKLRSELVFNYFKFGYVNSFESVFPNVYKVEPGSYIKMNLNSNIEHIYQTKYWSLSSSNPKKITKLKDLVNNFYEILKSSITFRFNSDVPVGVFLSSGLDSNLLVKISIDTISSSLEAFTLKSLDFEKNDLINSKKLNRNFINFELENSWDAFKKLTSSYDEPFSDPATIGLYNLSKVAAEKNIKVVLVGDGGDELLAGYSSYSGYINSLTKNKNIWKFLRFIYSFFSPLISFFIEKYIYFSKIQSLVYYHALLSGNSAMKINSIVENSYNKFASTITNNSCKPINSIEKGSSYDLLNLLNHKTKTELLHQLNYKTDVSGMLNTIEIREPLLDYRLFELQQNIDEKLFLEMVSNKNSKLVLRCIFNEKLGLDISKVSKKGFNLDIDSIFMKYSMEIDEIFRIYESPNVNIEFCQKLWNGYKEGYVNVFFINRVISYVFWEISLYKNINVLKNSK